MEIYSQQLQLRQSNPLSGRASYTKTQSYLTQSSNHDMFVKTISQTPQFQAEKKQGYMNSVSFGNGIPNFRRFHFEILRSAKTKVKHCAMENKSWNSDIGAGIITATFDEIQDIFKFAKTQKPKTTLNDVQNAFKIGKVMHELRYPIKHMKTGENVNIGKYGGDSVAAFIYEAEKAGELDTNGEKSTENVLRCSFRSQDGTNYAELLGDLFNGSGHSGIGGGKIKGPRINLNSKFSVIVDGNKAADANEIYSALLNNHNVKKTKKGSFEELEDLLNKIEIVRDERKGKTLKQIVENMIAEFRWHYADDSVFDSCFAE